MPRTRLISAITTLLVLISLSGCSSRVGDYSIISITNAELGKRYARMAPDVAHIAREGQRSVIIIIPIGIPNFKEALEKSLEKSGAPRITDAVIYYDYFYIPMIFNDQKTKVDGLSWNKVEDLSSQVNKDILNAKQIFILKEIDGKPQFVVIEKSDLALDAIH